MERRSNCVTIGGKEDWIIIKLLLSLNLVLYISLCNGSVRKFAGIAGELYPFITHLNHLSRGKITIYKVKDITMGFEKINRKTKKGEPIIGTCNDLGYPGDLVPKEITIDTEFWNTSNYNQKLFLLIHEILHCFANRDHVLGTFEDKCPTSLMNAVQPTNKCIEKHFEQYLAEAFRGLP